MSDKIQTLHPDPAKKGCNIDRAKYDLMRRFILNSLQNGEASYQSLVAGARQTVPNFDGSIGWYLETVKQDLIARGEIEVVEKKKPQHLRLPQK